MVPGSDLGITVEGKVIPGKKPSEHLREKPMRRASERQCKAKKRESMTEQEHVEHKMNERQYQARKRARESKHETVSRKTKNRCSMANARSKVRPVITVIEEFQTKVKVCPEYVCTSCHRMMYKHSVVTFKPTKYTQASPELLGRIKLISIVMSAMMTTSGYVKHVIVH